LASKLIGHPSSVAVSPDRIIAGRSLVYKHGRVGSAVAFRAQVCGLNRGVGDKMYIFLPKPFFTLMGHLPERLCSHVILI
jgi:hypothetical protein